MTVFLLFYASCDCDKLVGVYSSREKAEKRIKEYTPYDRPALYIEEEVVV